MVLKKAMCLNSASLLFIPFPSIDLHYSFNILGDASDWEYSGTTDLTIAGSHLGANMAPRSRRGARV